MHSLVHREEKLTEEKADKDYLAWLHDDTFESSQDENSRKPDHEWHEAAELGDFADSFQNQR